MCFDPANKAFFEVEDFATDLYSGRSNAFGMASLKGAFAHAEILCGLSFRHATKTRLICHAENRFAVSKKVKQPDGLPNGRSYARVSRDMMLAMSISFLDVTAATLWRGQRLQHSQITIGNQGQSLLNWTMSAFVRH